MKLISDESRLRTNGREAQQVLLSTKLPRARGRDTEFPLVTNIFIIIGVERAALAPSYCVMKQRKLIFVQDYEKWIV